MATFDDGPEFAPPGSLPDGLYVREVAEFAGEEPASDESEAHPVRRWRITGRNPEFWWELVITLWRGADAPYELRCTRCGLSDQAAAIGDLLRLVSFGAHLHDVDPVAGHGPDASTR